MLLHWEIQRAHGETKMYTMLNKTLEDINRGLSFSGYCFDIDCYLEMEVSPKDRRYNGAQITGVLNVQECFNSFNVTDPMTLQWWI